VLAYHDATKHHPQRYARGPGQLDWGTQPNPFRRYEGASLVLLLLGGCEQTPAYDDLFVPRAVPPQPVNQRSVSTFFECSLGLTAWKSYRGASWPLRCNPSSGNLHPTEGYLLAGPLAGIGETPGVYHYAPREHALERRHEIPMAAWQRLMEGWGDAAFLVGLSSIHWREAWKYGERAFRYCQHDVGHALAGLRFAAAMQGWRMIVLDGPGDADIGRLLGVDRSADYADAEREHPELIALVAPPSTPLAPPPASVAPPSRRCEPGPDANARRSVPAGDGIDCEAIDAAAAGPWSGQANRLSSGHVPWEIIDVVAEASHKPRGRPAGVGSPVPGGGGPTTDMPRRSRDQSSVGPPWPTWNAGESSRSEEILIACSKEDVPIAGRRQAPTARQIVLQRRSGTDYDGKTPIGQSTFHAMLHRLLAAAGTSGRAAPWDAVRWPPMVHLFLFVHRVTGLPPGLYALVRDPSMMDELRKATSVEFAWQHPPGCPDGLPLYLLKEADCRRASAQLSLGQEIAADGAFSLAMIAEFERPLREYGPWSYRRLFWEAGMIGQVLYLEAEAAGVRCQANIRGTGMGAYFDDWVHETLGLDGHAFQDLYHFTVGGAVDDDTLTTLPPYGATRH
jgi:SagB-type dehydrogenase family enzyme